MHEGHSLPFRAEAYGVTPHFTFPAASTLSRSFGRISGTYNPFDYVDAAVSDASARVLQFAMRYAF